MRRSLPQSWTPSISQKLYLIVGVMAVLIAGELFTLRFAMRQLSAVRTFVGGEGLWSKAQKNSLLALHRYGMTRDEAEFQRFLDFLRIPEGDRQARVELLKPRPDLAKVRAGFIQGRVHPDDIDSVIEPTRSRSGPTRQRSFHSCPSTCSYEMRSHTDHPSGHEPSLQRDQIRRRKAHPRFRSEPKGTPLHRRKGPWTRNSGR